MKIAIIGSGIAGLTAGYILSQKHDITIFEKNDYVGGHCRTKEIELDGKTIPIDTGFVVFNKENYPNLVRLLNRLGIKYQPSKMSFGVSINNGELEYSNQSLGSMFAQRKNLYNLKFLKMLLDIFKFCRKAPKVVHKNPKLIVEELLRKLGLGNYFKDCFLLPLAGAIWNSSLEQILKFPALTLVNFFDNHGFLSVTNQLNWQTIIGGSNIYIKKLTDSFEHKMVLSNGITNVTRDEYKVYLTDEKDIIHEFDQVIFACHSDQVLEILSNPSEDELAIIGSIKYQKNKAVVHTDESFMPKLKECWSSWVYMSPSIRNTSRQLSMTYWMNNLQYIASKKSIFITLNPNTPVNPGCILDEHEFEHPIFDSNAIIAQLDLDKIQGENKTWFAGAYTRYGFHEDAILSAIKIAEKIGVKLPYLFE